MTALLDSLAAILTPEASDGLREIAWLVGILAAAIGAVAKIISRANKAMTDRMVEIAAEIGPDADAIQAAVDVAVDRAVKRALQPIEARQLGIESMVRELVPNGGSSLSDAITRIEAEVARLRSQPPVVIHQYPNPEPPEAPK